MTILSVAALLSYFSLFLLCSPQWPQAAQHYTATALLASWTTLSLSLSLSLTVTARARVGPDMGCVSSASCTLTLITHSLLPLSAEE